MSFVITFLKCIASILLLIAFVMGLRKADKRTHLHMALAEYMAGFVFAFGSAWGFYHMWW